MGRAIAFMCNEPKDVVIPIRGRKEMTSLENGRNDHSEARIHMRVNDPFHETLVEILQVFSFVLRSCRVVSNKRRVRLPTCLGVKARDPTNESKWL